MSKNWKYILSAEEKRNIFEGKEFIKKDLKTKKKLFSKHTRVKQLIKAATRYSNILQA